MSDFSSYTRNADGSISIDGVVVPGSNANATNTPTDQPKDTSVNPLASTSVVNSDGSTTAKNADGTSTTKYGDGSTTVVNSDGSKTVTNKDGSTSTVAAPIVTPAAITQNAKNLTDPALNKSETVDPTMQQVKPGETVDPNAGNYTAKTAAAASATAAQASGASPTQANTTTATTIGVDNTPQATAAQGDVKSQDQVTAAQQNTLSPALQKTLDDWNASLAAVGVDPNSTVQGQYAKLTDFSNGIPAWAQGAMTQANQVMAARGLGDSSVAGGAITTAILQAALPIAQQDAQVFQTLQLQKLNQQQASVFLQAGYIANMDATNLANNQQANVINAQNFMQMDMSNLNNEQQAAVINTQSRLQTMLSDQSATNAAAQFNATSKNQTDQFYSNLNATISQFNTAQTNGMAQFNAGQADAIAQFNTAQSNAAAAFSAQNQVAIDQANATYLRNVNTTNTAATNSANLVNTQNTLNISNTAMANALQLVRDQASYTFQADQNAQDRAEQATLLGIQNQNWQSQYSTIQTGNIIGAIGGAALKIATSYLNNGASNSGGVGSGGQNSTDSNPDTGGGQGTGAGDGAGDGS